MKGANHENSKLSKAPGGCPEGRTGVMGKTHNFEIHEDAKTTQCGLMICETCSNIISEGEYVSAVKNLPYDEWEFRTWHSGCSKNLDWHKKLWISYLAEKAVEEIQRKKVLNDLKKEAIKLIQTSPYIEIDIDTDNASESARIYFSVKKDS